MKVQKIFKRYELKYMLTEEQKEELDALMKEHMHPDEHKEDLVSSIYFDTEDKILIRRSIEKPVYKEKLRIRFYGEQADSAHTFVELKKKYKKVVFKRRLTLEEYFSETGQPQITKEIEYFTGCYPGLAPSAYISYQREAWYSNEDRNFRMTFDRNIRYREFRDGKLADGAGGPMTLKDPVTGKSFTVPVNQDLGRPLLPEGMYLLEVKTALGLPRWLLDFLNANRIYKTSFSKYGNGYKLSFFTDSDGRQTVTKGNKDRRPAAGRLVREGV